MKLRPVYLCHYDGKKCDQVTPKFDSETGMPVKVSNEHIKERYHGIVDEDLLEQSWDVCDKCSRNCCMSGFCYGMLRFEDESGGLYKKIFEKC